jgi:hypothetical protein
MRKTSYGSDPQRVILAGGSVIYVQSGGFSLREYVFDFATQNFTSPDILELADHLPAGGIRCIAYAKGWGYGSLIMLNLFAFRATDPKAMLVEPDPAGEWNDAYLLMWANACREEDGIVVSAWGNHGAHRGRSAAVREMLSAWPLYYLKMTKAGEPGHPLYLSGLLNPKRLSYVAPTQNYMMPSNEAA